MRIRSTRIAGNQGGRAGCQFQSPFTNQIYYASIEHGALVLRDWAGSRRGGEDGVALTPSGGLSADFASPGEVCVTVAGFDPGTGNSGMDTYIIDMSE